jgi:hypothetical protein
VDDINQQSAPEAEAPAEQQPEPQEGRTPEEVEAFWRKRQSNEAKAHSEETRVLREQLAQAQRAVSTDAASGGSDAAAALQQQVQQLQQQLKQSEQQRIVDTRRAMYPEAAEALADNVLISQMDEARLAALNAKLGAEAAAPRMDANNPSRGASVPAKRIQDMSADELKAVLAQESQAWLNEVRSQ